MNPRLLDTPHRRARPQAHAVVARGIATLLIGLGAVAAAQASEALANKHACAACHQPARKLVGPSWKDVAARYGGGALSAEQLAASIRKGSSGKWGPVPMPPQGHVPEAELQALAAWVLGAAK
jgi:cytochrome c